LEAALQAGYQIVSLEWFLAEANDTEQSYLILRHDVDQCPRSALRMLALERRLGLTATWYFRWRTARSPVIAAVRDAGGEVGLHYETLTRMVQARGEDATVTPELLAQARGELRRELIAFEVLFGPASSACAHGDTHVPHVTNLALLEGQKLGDYGLRFDANLSLRGRPLGLWLTDRSAADGGWRDGLSALEVLDDRTSPLLLLTHPNNWTSGPALWVDRLQRALLPTPKLSAGRPTRSGSDEPPLR